MLNAEYFIFDGINSSDYDMRIYYLDNSSTKELDFGNEVEIIEERLNRSVKPIFYGVNKNKPITHTFTCGCLDYISEEKTDEIIEWLTSPNNYRWLEFLGDDYVTRVKCIFTKVAIVHINGMPVAFNCEIQCDSPFSYSDELTKKLKITNDSPTLFTIDNKSVYGGYIYPTIKLKMENVLNLSVVNTTDDNHTMGFYELPPLDGELTIDIDNEKLIIKTNNNITEVYESFNDIFFRLVKGNNEIEITAEFYGNEIHNRCEIEIDYTLLKKLHSKNI